MLNLGDFVDPIRCFVVRHQTSVATANCVIETRLGLRHATFGGEFGQRVARMAVDPACTEIQRRAEAFVCPDPAADTVAGFEHRYSASLTVESICGSHTGHTCADHADALGVGCQNLQRRQATGFERCMDRAVAIRVCRLARKEKRVANRFEQITRLAPAGALGEEGVGPLSVGIAAPICANEVCGAAGTRGARWQRLKGPQRGSPERSE